MDADELPKVKLRRSEAICSSASFCRSTKTDGTLCLTDEFLAWTKGARRSWYGGLPFCVIPVENVKSARLTCSLLGLKKIVAFSIVDGYGGTRSESYYVDLIYPWARALSILGIPTSSDLPKRF